MAEIFDASGVAAGQSDGLINLASIFTGAFEPFTKAVEKFVSAVGDFTGAAKGIAGKGVTGESMKLPGPAPADALRKNDLLDEAFGFAPAKKSISTAIPVAKKIPTAKGIPTANPLQPPQGLTQGTNYLAIIANNTTALVHLNMSNGMMPTPSVISKGSNATGSSLAGAFSKGFGKGSSSTGGLGGIESLAKAMGVTAPMMAELGTAVGAALGPIIAVAAAMAAAAAATIGMVLAAHHFVQFVNPAAVLGFDLAMRDLNAVVGTLLLPVMNEATRVVREFAAYLYPIVTDLLPSFQKVVRSFSDVFVALLPIGASVLQAFAAFAPLIADVVGVLAEHFIPIIRAVAAITAGLVAGLKAWLASFSSLFGGDFKDAAKQAGGMLGLVAIAAAALAFQFLGMTEALNGMIADLQNGPKKQDATGLAVAQNARFQDVSGLGKEVAQRAFISSGRGDLAGKGDEMADFRKRALEIIDGIRDKSLIEAIGEAVAKGMLKALASGAAAANPVTVLQSLGDRGNTPELNSFRDFLGGFLDEIF